MLKIITNSRQTKSDEDYIKIQARRLAGRIKRHFDRQADYVIEKIKSLNLNTINDDFNIPEQEETTDDILLFWFWGMNRGSSQMIKYLKIPPETAITEAQKQSKITAKKRKENGRTNKNIHRTTENNIKRILNKGVSEGLSESELISLIEQQKKSGVFSDARSILIGETEIRRSHSIGKIFTARNFVALKTAETMVKKWITVGDDRVRATHNQNESDGWIKIDEFHSGTNEDVAPSEDFNCRCDEAFKIL